MLVGIMGIGFVLSFGTAIMGFPLKMQSAYAAHDTFSLGDVFVSVSNGKVNWYHPDGSFNQQLDTTQGGFTTGMAFDSDGKLYVTDFSANAVSVFDTDGTLLGTFGSGYSTPESIVFNAAGNAFVGSIGGTIREFDSTGTFVDSDSPGRVDFIDLSADQCTMLFTQEGTSILRYDVCTDTALTAFATGLGGQAFALRIMPTGDVLLANGGNILRIDSTGTIVDTYDVDTENSWFALNLDPDGTSFWSANFGSANVYKIDIATGAVLDSFNTGTGGNTVFGLGVFGEITVADPEYSLNLFEDSSPSDEVIDLGEDVRAVAETTDPLVTQVIFRWIDPSSNVDETTTVPLVAGEAEDSFIPDEIGTWIVEADFGNGQVVQKTLNIDFLVIPESPVGIAALVGSSLAALGAFMFLRKRSSGTGTIGTTGLGV
jgi:DNA-binding beta-propeller fold protein YncE